jgi:chromosome segregation protein
MHLKSLELHGYKTFASRTMFEFAGSVTAIVGPNGSGKSNIADSIRWVLGEQSYSLLRGKKTEDMIFSGSEQRTRAGMASATITFDNSDGWLPIDFSEVAVTRRAYRDSQNEYLINGQRVRLKDVSELLAQSGLAERTYTIIGQGLVDVALALKAEERRRLFEEAAGIGLHRARREEAIRRLETTTRNLDRVKDILVEIEPRLKSLERQARRAQEYEQVKADLQLILREWYGYHWHNSQLDLTNAREVVRTLESGLEQARQEQAAFEVKLTSGRERLTSLRSQLNSLHNQSSQLHGKREEVSKNIAVMDERIRSTIEQQQNIKNEQSNLVIEIELLQDSSVQAESEVKRLQLELEEARSQMVGAEKSLAARIEERSQVEKNVQSARQVLSSLNSRQGQFQARLKERRTQAERERRALQEAIQAVEKIENEHQTLENRLNSAQIAQRRLAALRRSAEDALEAHRERDVTVNADYKKTLDQVNLLSAEMARKTAQFDVLEQAEKTLSGYAAGTRVLVQAGQKQRLSGVRGVLSNFLEVKPELELAIVAALGEYLDAVLLEAHEDRAYEDWALDLLDGEAVRGVLLPLPGIRPSRHTNPIEPEDAARDDVIGIASELVHVAQEYRAIVDLLLGQVVVVRDRKAARKLARELAEAGNNSLTRTVTLQGEVFHTNGPIVAGNGSGKQSVLGRGRERKDLKNGLQQLDQQLKAINERVSQLEKDIQDLRAEASRLNQAQRAARQEEEKGSLQTRQIQLALEQVKRQLSWQIDQRQRLQSEIDRGEGEARQLVEELSGLETRIEEAREKMREHNAAFASIAIDEYQAQVLHWKTVEAVSRKALEDGRLRQQDREAALLRSKNSQATLVMRLNDMVGLLDNLEQEKINLRQAEVEINAGIDAIRAQIEPAEAELEDLEQGQAELQKAEVGTRQSLRQAENRYTQARLVQSRKQEALDALHRRIEEDFGLVAFEYADQVSGQTPLPLQGMVEQLPHISQLPAEIEENIKRQRAQLRRIGPINPEAQLEYQEVRQRFKFLTEQVNDLEKAEESVRQVISELDTLMKVEFRKTFNSVAAEFKQIFSQLFAGGTARLSLTDPDDINESGIEIEARLPGRRSQGLYLLSGGERSLTAVALIFALLKVAPTPFCVLDEVDAMLDEANVGRFCELLRELSQHTQFVVVTHNRNTVQVADVIYGITMGRDSTSQTLSLKLDEVSKIVDEVNSQ